MDDTAKSIAAGVASGVAIVVGIVCFYEIFRRFRRIMQRHREESGSGSAHAMPNAIRALEEHFEEAVESRDPPAMPPKPPPPLSSSTRGLWEATQERGSSASLDSLDTTSSTLDSPRPTHTLRGSSSLSLQDIPALPGTITAISVLEKERRGQLSGEADPS